MKKMNYKPKILKLSYLKEEAQNHESLFSDYMADFIKENPKYKKHLDQMEEDHNSNTKEEKKYKKHKDIKRLYRRISKVTHPDKSKSSFLESIFVQSTKDYKNNAMASLFATAVTLNIDVSDLDIEEILDRMDSEITTYEKSIKNFESSFPWRLANAKTQEEKDFIMIQVDILLGDIE